MEKYFYQLKWNRENVKTVNRLTPRWYLIVPTYKVIIYLIFPPEKLFRTHGRRKKKYCDQQVSNFYTAVGKVYKCQQREAPLALTRGARRASRRVAQRERSNCTLVYLISGLGTGVGIRWSDAMRAAGSLFTSPGISILLEVIFTLQLVRHCRLFSPLKKLPMCDRGFVILAGFITRCQARFVLIGPTGRAVLLKIKFTHLHKRSRPCVLRRRNASTPPTTHSPDTRTVFRRT